MDDGTPMNNGSTNGWTGVSPGLLPQEEEGVHAQIDGSAEGEDIHRAVLHRRLPHLLII